MLKIAFPEMLQCFLFLFHSTVGKRTQTESAGEEVFDFNVPDDSQKVSKD